MTIREKALTILDEERRKQNIVWGGRPSRRHITNQDFVKYADIALSRAKLAETEEDRLQLLKRLGGVVVAAIEYSLKSKEQTEQYGTMLDRMENEGE